MKPGDYIIEAARKQAAQIMKGFGLNPNMFGGG